MTKTYVTVYKKDFICHKFKKDPSLTQNDSCKRLCIPKYKTELKIKKYIVPWR